MFRVPWERLVTKLQTPDADPQFRLFSSGLRQIAGSDLHSPYQAVLISPPCSSRSQQRSVYGELLSSGPCGTYGRGDGARFPPTSHCWGAGGWRCAHVVLWMHPSALAPSPRPDATTVAFSQTKRRSLFPGFP